MPMKKYSTPLQSFKSGALPPEAIQCYIQNIFSGVVGNPSAKDTINVFYLTSADRAVSI